MIVTLTVNDVVSISAVNIRDFKNLQERARRNGQLVKIAHSPSGTRFLCNNMDADFGSFMSAYGELPDPTVLSNRDYEVQYIEYEPVVKCYLVFLLGKYDKLSNEEALAHRRDVLKLYFRSISYEERFEIKQAIGSHIKEQDQELERYMKELNMLLSKAEKGRLDPLTIIISAYLSEQDKESICHLLESNPQDREGFVKDILCERMDTLTKMRETVRGVYSDLFTYLDESRLSIELRGNLDDIRTAIRLVGADTFSDSALIKVGKEYSVLAVCEKLDIRLWEFVHVIETNNFRLLHLREQHSESILIERDAASIIVKYEF